MKRTYQVGGVALEQLVVVLQCCLWRVCSLQPDSGKTVHSCGSGELVCEDAYTFLRVRRM